MARDNSFLAMNCFGGGGVRVGSAALMLLGLGLGAAIYTLLGPRALSYALMLAPLIAVAHELLHLAAIRARGLSHRFVARGLMVGYVVEFDRSVDYVACALAPQLITLGLATAFAFTGIKWLAALAVLHLAISVNDIAKSVKYLLNDLLRDARSRR